MVRTLVYALIAGGMVAGVIYCGFASVRPESRLIQHSSPEKLDLSVGLLEDWVLVSPLSDVGHSRLLIANRGSLPVILEDIKRGCTCSEIRTGQLPLALSPGQECSFEVSLRSQAMGELANHGWIIETADGDYQAQTKCMFWRDVELRPRNMHLTLEEGDIGYVDFALRQVVPKERLSSHQTKNDSLRDDTFEFEPPTGVEVTKLAQSPERTVTFSSQSQFDVVQTRYRISVTSGPKGWHEGTLKVMKGPDRTLADQIVVTWRTSPFAEMCPSAVTIGKRQARAVLRCFDSNVELVSVLSCPAGYDAVLTSPRELVIVPTSQKSLESVSDRPLCDERIVLATTSERAPKVEILVSGDGKQ